MQHPSLLGDYRPICLVDCLYKVLSKVIVERLKRVLCKIASQSQRAFIIGRLLMDVVMVINEILDFAKKAKQDCLLLKGDFELAYDCVN